MIDQRIDRMRELLDSLEASPPRIAGDRPVKLVPGVGQRVMHRLDGKWAGVVRSVWIADDRCMVNYELDGVGTIRTDRSESVVAVDPDAAMIAIELPAGG